MKETFKLVGIDLKVEEIELNVIANDYIQALVNYFIANPLKLESTPKINIYLPEKYFMLNDILIKSAMIQMGTYYRMFTKRIPAVVPITPGSSTVRKVDLYPTFIIPNGEYTEFEIVKMLASRSSTLEFDDHTLFMDAHSR